MRSAPVVTLSITDRSALERMLQGEGKKRRSTLRVWIVRLAAEGKPNKEIAAILGVTQKTVSRWRQRFVSSGTPAIEEEKPGRGRPPSISQDQIKQIIAKLTEKRWTTRMTARMAGVSASTVRRIWKQQSGPERQSA
jgi:hypothetical protein